MTEKEFTYGAFLSYSQQDNHEQRPDSPDAGNVCWGDWLHAELKAFSIPAIFAGQMNARGESVPERIDPIYPDNEEQPENANLSENVCKALEQSNCLVVICSPRSAKSLHVNEAVRYFKQLGRGNRILPIVIAGEPNVTDGKPPGVSPDNECFVPALRYPVKPDGTLDVARRELGSIFADARQADTKREILAKDQEGGAIELETAKIQLIAGLIGVGFNGLWGHEIKRLFAEAKFLAQEARLPSEQTENRNLAPETQTEILAAQNQTREAQQQIQELRNQAQAAQSKVFEAQHQAREALGQVTEARNQAQAAESKVLEAQTQLEEARHQVREAQSKFLEVQNLPQDVKSQIEEAHTKAREAQSHIEAARNEVRETQNKFLELQNLAREAQSQVQEITSQARETQSQLEAAQNQARIAESKVLEAQQQARDAQTQVVEARNQVRDAQNKISETQTQARLAQSQLEETRDEARAAQNKYLEAQNQVRAAQTHVQEIQNKSQASRRLTKIFAVMAVLALMAAACLALWQQKKITEAPAKAPSVAASEPDLAAGPLNREQIQQALQKFAAVGHDQNLLNSLDELVTRIPLEAIPDTLNAAVVILNDPQRRHFQEQLLDCWVKTNLPAAFDWSCQLTNLDFRQRALEKIIPAVAADNLTNTLARLNDLKPAPSEQIYTKLFQQWAAKDPVQAMEQRQLIPGHDASGRILSDVLGVWADQQPAAALNWLQSQPDSEALPAGTWRNLMIAGLFDVWAAKDLDAAWTACQQLPDGRAKEKGGEFVLSRRIQQEPESAAQYVTNLPAGDYRENAIKELCEHWPGTNVLLWAQSLPIEVERTSAINQIIAKWAHTDPQSAIQFTNVYADLSGATLGGIAQTWAQSDLSATTNWVASLPDGQKKNSVRLALAETWAQHDPNGLAAYALGLPAGDIQTQYLTAAWRQLPVRDLPATVELLQRIADAALRQDLLEKAAGSYDLRHLESAANYISIMPAGDDQKAAIKGLIVNWTSFDPEAAINWLVSFPATNSQPELVQSVIKTWSQPEPSVVAQWLANLPAGTGTDGMVGAFLEGAVAKYPDYAAQWTQSVTDETQRQKYQIQVARQWMKTDSSAATKWVDSLSLPEETKQLLKAPSP